MMGPGLKDFLDLLSPRKRLERMYIPYYYAQTFSYLGMIAWFILAIATQFIFPNQPRWLKYLLLFLLPAITACIGYFYGIRLREKTGKKLVRELRPHHRWDWSDSPAIEYSAAVFFGFVILFAVVYLVWSLW